MFLQEQSPLSAITRSFHSLQIPAYFRSISNLQNIQTRHPINIEAVILTASVNGLLKVNLKGHNCNRLPLGRCYSDRHTHTGSENKGPPNLYYGWHGRESVPAVRNCKVYRIMITHLRVLVYGKLRGEVHTICIVENLV